MCKILTKKEQLLKRKEEVAELIDDINHGEMEKLCMLRKKEIQKGNSIFAIFSDTNWLKVSNLDKRIKVLSDVEDALLEYHDILEKNIREGFNGVLD